MLHFGASIDNYYPVVDKFYTTVVNNEKFDLKEIIGAGITIIMIYSETEELFAINNDSFRVMVDRGGLSIEEFMDIEDIQVIAPAGTKIRWEVLGG